jgi:hypothetical protein
LKHPLTLIAAFVATSVAMSLAAPDYATFQTVKWGDSTIAVTKANVPENATLKIKIVKRAKTELGVLMYSWQDHKVVSGIQIPNLMRDGTPAKVWQAVRVTGFNDYNRDYSDVTEGQVLEYVARNYHIPYSGGGPKSVPVAIGIISCPRFPAYSGWANVTSCEQEGDVCHIKTSDGWELDVKVIGPDF